MKIITIFITVIFLSSCTKEYMTPDNDINCTSNYENHPNADAFQAVIDNYANDGFVGMTLLIDKPIDGLWIGSSGYASIENNIKMNPCHVHHTASLYKTYIKYIIRI